MSDPLMLLQHLMGPKLRAKIAVARACADLFGDYLYVGANNGSTSQWIARLLENNAEIHGGIRRLHLVDSFTDELKDQVRQLHTQPFVKIHSGDIAELVKNFDPVSVFSCVICDMTLYQDVEPVLEMVFTRLNMRGAAYFDHYAKDNLVPGVKMAIDEFMARHNEYWAMEPMESGVMLSLRDNPLTQARLALMREMKNPAKPVTVESGLLV